MKPFYLLGIFFQFWRNIATLKFLSHKIVLKLLNKCKAILQAKFGYQCKILIQKFFVNQSEMYFIIFFIISLEKNFKIDIFH